MKNFYIFPSNVRLKVNVVDDILSLFYMGQSVNINMSVLRDGSSTMVLFNPMHNLLYTLYNFRELLTVFNLSPTEFLGTFGQLGLLQMDKCGGEVFCKIFGDVESDTTDFSACRYMTADMIHPLDWRYSWTCENVGASLEGGRLKVSLTLNRSDFWTRDIYASHGGQVARLKEGVNEVEFVYVRGENVYIGEPNRRYTARALDIKRLLQPRGSGR